MQTEENYRHYQDNIDEVHGIDKTIVKLIIVGVCNHSHEDLRQNISSECLHGYVHREEEESWCKI